MAGLTTHILDTTRGRPASGVEIELHVVGPDGARVLVARARTNADGRTEKPLIAAGDARAGVFELSFHIGDYFRASGDKTSNPPFLDVVPIRFAITDPETHYHVPLVATPWSYSTYRGS